MSDTFATVEVSLEDLEALQRKAARAENMQCAIEIAYGFLWHYQGVAPEVHKARKELLVQIDKAGQKRGIENSTRTLGELVPIIN